MESKEEMRKTVSELATSTLESKGNLVKIQIPRECPRPKEYTPHSCSTKCGYSCDEDKFRKVSPLAIPFYLGWNREITRTCGTMKIYYDTPCGIRLGSYSAIRRYVIRTGTEIPMDFFSMDLNIDCLSKFEPLEKRVYVKDLSHGEEWTPISCVNSLDHELPPIMEYVTGRTPGEGVTINLEDDFLICCDCEDDCQDKAKCACQQLTLSGITFKLATKAGIEINGYENRRLDDHVLSGIYECNQRCKCRSTCLNRVAQNKVKWPLQLFKTAAKGWGVRTLHDIPKGSFVGVYAGQVLTAAEANVIGVQEGDEYMAELDFIECNEEVKQGYESDCSDIETEEPGTRSTSRQLAITNEIEENGKALSVIHSYPAGLPTARKSGSKNGGPGKSKLSATRSPTSSPSVVLCPANSTMSNGCVDTQSTRAAIVDKNVPRLPLRQYFGEDEATYILDAKKMGNFTKFINHSCSPNVISQNVFVDTHDPRFPVVAFFTKTDVKAGTELTWDYNYAVGSVPGKAIDCKCLQPCCRGRLL